MAALVRSGWPAVWLTVTAGAVASNWTTLSVLVAVPLAFPAASNPAPPAGMEATTAPGEVIPVTLTM